MPGSVHPFILTEDEDRAVRALYSSSFPHPTLRQASHSSYWGPVGGDDYTPHERRFLAAANGIIAKGLCECGPDGRYRPTSLTDAYRAFEERGRELRAVYQALDRLSRQLKQTNECFGESIDRMQKSIDDVL